MRLINVETRKMEEFFGTHKPDYLILSHTWGEEEISFQDYMSLLNYDEEVAAGIVDELPPRQRDRIIGKADALRQRSGYHKVSSFINRAREMCVNYFRLKAWEIPGRLYVWVDTCCINKESSVELSEAINSMFSWYRDAYLCIAILSDVTGVDPDPHGEFGNSRWFTRGWTLQELLAPTDVVFYNGNYELIGCRGKLSHTIAAVTSIHNSYMTGFLREKRELREATVAEKMSWAARRETTRIEDQAYCLLGIFDVNMPHLYGEGPKAFVRLQQEIIKASEDRTIFAWGYKRGISNWVELAVFASSTSDFAHGGSLTEAHGILSALNLQHTNGPFEMTNLGLRITLGLLRLSEGIGKIYAILPVVHKGRGHVCVPVSWNSHGDEGFENIQNGAVVERRAQEPPVVCAIETILSHASRMSLVERSVILRSVPQCISTPKSTASLEDFFVTLVVHSPMYGPESNVLEIWNPSMGIDRSRRWEYGRLKLKGTSNKHRWGEWPLFLRARSSDATATEYLIAVSLSFTPGSVNWIRTFDWDCVRTVANPPVHSLLGLYMASLQPGGPAMRSAAWPESRNPVGVCLRLQNIKTISAEIPVSPPLLVSRLDSPESPHFTFVLSEADIQADSVMKSVR